MTLPTRNISSYTLPYQNTGLLLAEDGSIITTEDNEGLLIDNPTQDPNLTARNVSAIAAYPTRN